MLRTWQRNVSWAIGLERLRYADYTRNADETEIGPLEKDRQGPDCLGRVPTGSLLDEHRQSGREGNKERRGDDEPVDPPPRGFEIGPGQREAKVNGR